MTLRSKKGKIVTKVVHIFTNLITPSAKEMSARVDEDEPVGASVSGAARSLAGRRSRSVGRRTRPACGVEGRAGGRGRIVEVERP